MRLEEPDLTQEVNYIMGDLITIKSKGDWKKSIQFLDTISVFHLKTKSILNHVGAKGVEILKENTPKDTGKASDSWFYTISYTREGMKITWHNDDIEGGCNVIILLQYGHATKDRGFVYGDDFIMPIVQDLFEELADDLWREVEDA